MDKYLIATMDAYLFNFRQFCKACYLIYDEKY